MDVETEEKIGWLICSSIIISGIIILAIAWIFQNTYCLFLIIGWAGFILFLFTPLNYKNPKGDR